jgi:UDP-N-acetylmuramoylalanine--D-glutamate ligase
MADEPSSSAMADEPSSSAMADEPVDGRTVLVCGARFAGLAAVGALRSRAAAVLLTDRLRPDPMPEGVVFSPELSDVPDGVDLVVTSPGWRPSHPLFASAAARGIEVIGEVELAWRLRAPGAPPWLALTGTNGKTTTVRMLESILRANGLRAIAVGNVGVSIIDAVLAGDMYDVLAVELSSFQLHWSSTVHSLAGAVLNIAPDHLDWHSTMADYADAKVRIWQADVAIGNRDDPTVMRLLEAAPAQSRRVEFTLGEPAPGQFGVVAGMLVHANPDGGTAALLPAADVRPRGQHNVANALAASALADAVGVTPGAIAAGLRSFVPDPHRNQHIASVGGVDFIDDSKATNPHAARASLLSYQRIVWIAGGQLKGAPVDELVAEVAPRLAAAVLLGADRGQLFAALRRHAPDVPVIEVELTDDRAMSEVVRTAAVLARPGDTVVLAPAAASYDMFSGYAARGAAFAAAIEQLRSIESGEQ